VSYDVPEELVVESVGAVRVVTLNRPAKLNAISQPLHHALREVWGQIAADGEARAVVLTGAGKAFCAGGDVENFIRNHNDITHRRRSIRGARRLFDEIIDFPLPIVAAVNGPAIGLGCTLAVLADLVLMADTAHLAESHVAIGLVAGDGGTALWPLMMSILKAKELVLLGDRISAEDAVRFGLANRVVPPDKLMAEALALAQRLADLPPQAVQETKRAFNLHIKRAALDVMDVSLQAEFESFGTDHVRQMAEKMVARSRPGSPPD
jgi:enoyl-CoA hydratase